MQQQRVRDTAPELAVRRLLHATGFRFRVDRRPLAGLRRRADIVFGPSKVAVYVDGCFWHGCPQHGRRPAANSKYWAAKLARNQQRDADTDAALGAAGWVVVRVWEHEDPAAVAGRVTEVVRRRRPLPRRNAAHSSARPGTLGRVPPADAAYGPEAYAPDGTLWWELRIRPGTKKAKYGDEPKTAAWLANNREVGSTFTMRELRQALGDVVPNDAEHLNRRMRNLRPWGWDIASARDDGSLKQNEYRIRVVGWHPGTGRPAPKKDVPSDRTRRLVFERDRSTCVICGVAAGEPYPGETKLARMTLGHRIPGNRATSATSADDLQTECARCNETVRDEMHDPVTLTELLPTVRGLSRAEKTTLLKWLTAGRRIPTRADQVFAQLRQLTPDERQQLTTDLAVMVNGAG